MLKRPIQGTKGPAQTALLMITRQQIEHISQLDRLPPACIEWLEWRTERSLLACGRTTAWGSTWSSTLPRTRRRLTQATFAPGYGPHDLSTCSRMKKTALTMIVITIVIIDVVVVVVVAVWVIVVAVVVVYITMIWHQ